LNKLNKEKIAVKKSRWWAVSAIVVLASVGVSSPATASSGTLVPGSTDLATEPIVVAPAADEVPGMCKGRTDPNIRIEASARGTIGYLLNVWTDSSGRPRGALTLHQGGTWLRITQWCRLWQHNPGDEAEKGEEEIPEGATVAHVVGTGTLADGTPILVRTDLRSTGDGNAFRVRYRPLGGHDEPHDEVTVSAHDDEEEEGWVRFPAEGWAPLQRFNLRIIRGIA
jgi:hypothetical protein